MKAEWLGRVPYRWAWTLQRLRREAVIAGSAPEVLWLLEHPEVITVGRRPVAELPRGVEVVRTERGGLATWHGPGQLVGYLIADVGGRGIGVRSTIEAVEEGLIRWLDGVGIAAARRPGFPGVWVGSDKIAAIGMHFRRGVSMHGFALNLEPDLSGFGSIVPCGIRDGGVSSVRAILGEAPSPEQVAEEVGRGVIDSVLRAG